MSGRLAGKVALITGGTSGIGEATVELFVAEGAKVLFSGRSSDKGEAMAEQLGEAASFHRADVMHEDQIEASIVAAKSRFGRLDVLFNNAGGPTHGGLEDVTVEDFDHAMHLLLGSVVFGIKHAAPIMKEQGEGAIINNSSVAALRTHMGGYLYSAAKAAVTQLTRVAGIALAEHGVTVNSISPGGIATPIFYGGSQVSRELDPEHDAGKMKKLQKNLASFTPLKRTGLPQDIAHAALYLASDEGRFVTCHDLVVDAGMTARGQF